MVRHELGTRAAVQPDGEQVSVFDRGVKRVGGLARQHGPHGFDGARNDYRDAPAEFTLEAPDGQQAGLDVARILAGFEQQNIGAAIDQRFGEIVVILLQMVERNGAADGDAFACRTHGTGHEARLARGGELARRLARQPRRRNHQVVGFAIDPVIHQVAFGPIERIGFNDIGAGFQVRAMDRQHHVGARLHQDFVAALQRRPTEIRGREMLLLQHGAHGAVDDQNAGVEGMNQGCAAFVTGGHR